MHEAFHGDFSRLLEHKGVSISAPRVGEEEGLPAAHGTTVIALKYEEGILNVADRRATSSTGILYDEAEKVLVLDEYTLIAIAGSYAPAAEAARFLKHSFKYFARSQLQEMSLEGKLAEVSKVLSQSIPSVLQGIGGFLPIVSVYDRNHKQGRIFFYDVLGARFESREYGSAGSGAEKIRGTFEYITRTRGPFHVLPLEEVLKDALLLLDIAASLDPATAGLGGVLPLGKTITAAGVADIPEEKIRALQRKLLSES
ncbi:MAG: hypothetical protein A2Z21_05190 [Candidatus Fraserbacteria bacterium RBG_16_55_9]|uniref:Proteasome subunit alpha n=1 Tax=Fraserbacteria sp. (strain RBG_16_55_9) TaxID=1817864 RepID=A0A1F5US77_FRAXR|nr:MAG: hypothetical protein A2Z21_05190 [Candidatus Fraserbacteria bacterium RBG_16_55_9]